MSRRIVCACRRAGLSRALRKPPGRQRTGRRQRPRRRGWISAALAQLVDLVGVYKQDSLLIIRHGKIVVDAYYAPYAPNIRHDLRSVTKSFTGTLTAIELREGFLDSVDHPIVDLFADKHISNLDDAKKAMTVQNMLDMTSGIAWNERFYSPDETVMQMYRSPDRMEFVLSQPMSDPPGAALQLRQRRPARPLRPDHPENRTRRARFCAGRALQAARHFERSLGRRRRAGRDRRRKRPLPHAPRHGEARLSLSSRGLMGRRADHPVFVGRSRERGAGEGDEWIPLCELLVVASRTRRLHGARPSLAAHIGVAETRRCRGHDRRVEGRVFSDDGLD